MNVQCPHCNRALNIPASLLEAGVRCPLCRKAFGSEAVEAQPAPPVVDKVRGTVIVRNHPPPALREPAPGRSLAPAGSRSPRRAIPGLMIAAVLVILTLFGFGFTTLVAQYRNWKAAAISQLFPTPPAIRISMPRATPTGFALHTPVDLVSRTVMPDVAAIRRQELTNAEIAATKQFNEQTQRELKELNQDKLRQQNEEFNALLNIKDRELNMAERKRLDDIQRDAIALIERRRQDQVDVVKERRSELARRREPIETKIGNLATQLNQLLVEYEDLCRRKASLEAGVIPWRHQLQYVQAQILYYRALNHDIRGLIHQQDRLISEYNRADRECYQINMRIEHVNSLARTKRVEYDGAIAALSQLYSEANTLEQQFRALTAQDAVPCINPRANPR